MPRFITAIFLFSHCLAMGADFEWDRPVHSDILAPLIAAEGVRILWWNVHDGHPASKPAPSFSRNLLQMIRSPLSPDIIAFAEYGDSSLTPDALKELNSLYPYHAQWNYPYVSENNFGTAFYSKFQFNVTEIAPLDVTPIKLRDENLRSQYREDWCSSQVACTRNFISIEMNIGTKNFQFIPVHLFDIWRKYKAVKGSQATAEEVLFGENNPLANQMLRFLSLLNKRMNLMSETVIMGDFNIPKRLLGIQTSMYRTLQKNFHEVVEDNETSFPAMEAEEHGHFPEMQIDHAFTTGSLKTEAAHILSLKGSDHYPLYFVVK